MLLSPHRSLVDLALAAGLAIVAVLLSRLWPGNPFAPYMGELPPLLVLPLTAIAASLAINLLARHGQIGRRQRLRPGLILAVGAGFAVPTIAVDIAAPWPQDINVALPQGVFFYGAIAFFAECLFHVIPLGLLFGLFQRLAPRASPHLAFWSAAALATIIEPAVQIAFDPHAPLGRTAYMGLQLTAFGLAQIALMRLYGLWGALGARLGYYLLWHIVWGTARLPLLFAPS